MPWIVGAKDALMTLNSLNYNNKFYFKCILDGVLGEWTTFGDCGPCSSNIMIQQRTRVCIFPVVNPGDTCASSTNTTSSTFVVTTGSDGLRTEMETATCSTADGCMVCKSGS